MSIASPTLKPGISVVITGATGFIGGRLAELCLAAGAKVVCLVRNAEAGAALVAKGIALKSLDLARPEPVAEALRGAELVFHCAYDWSDEAWNFAALRVLIAACGAQAARLVHVSSFVAYEVPEEGELTEQSPETHSRTGYAWVKSELDRELLQAVQAGRVAASIVQPTIVYGPGCKPWTLDPANMLRHGVVVLPDAGEGICAAVYVDDVAAAMMLAGQVPEAVGQRYLINGPMPVTWKQFFEGFARGIGAGLPRYVPAGQLARAARRASGKSGKLLGLALDPLRVVRKAARIGSARRIVQAGLRGLPAGMRARVQDSLFSADTNRRGFVHMPDEGRLDLLRSRVLVSSAKAERELGYAPQFTFALGLVPTVQYLNDLWQRPGKPS